MNTPKDKQTEEKKEEFIEHEQNWENPKAPEHAVDKRDIEQLERQKKTAEIRKDNLTDPKED